MNIMKKKLLVLLTLVGCSLQIFSARSSRSNQGTRQTTTRQVSSGSNVTRSSSNNNARNNRWRNRTYNRDNRYYNDDDGYYYDGYGPDYGPYYYDGYDNTGAAIASTAGLIGGVALGSALANR